MNFSPLVTQTVLLCLLLVLTLMMDSFWKNTIRVYKYLVILLGTCNMSISKRKTFNFVSGYTVNQQKKSLDS